MEHRLDNPYYEEEDNPEDGKQYVNIVGNLSEGFRAIGPFTNFEAACKLVVDEDTWIMTLESPEEAGMNEIPYGGE